MRKRRLAAIAILDLLVGIGFAQGSDSRRVHAICIEHAGDSDKPLAGIAISSSDFGTGLCRKDSDARVGLTNVWEHVVHLKLVLRLAAIVEGISSDADEHPHEFGQLYT
jgi:hypothetical protein